MQEELRNFGLESELQFLQSCAYGMIVCGIFIAIILKFVPGPYGRFSSPHWGPAVSAQVSWVIQEAPSFIIPALLLTYTNCAQWNNPANRVLAAAFMLHYFQRSFIYPFLITPSKPTPFVTHFAALIFCSINGYLQGRYHLEYAIYNTDEIYGLRMLAGLIIFMTGMYINLHSDHILRNLRKPGETGYKIPRGGLFEFVSAANYFGEILEWSGYALAAGTLPATAFVFFTACNLIPRAMSYHENYLQKFDDYPRERKAIIPFLL